MNTRTLLKFLTFIFLLTTVFAVKAQTGGTVAGKLVDASTGQILDFATVALIRKTDNQPAKSMQTDLQGNFKLTGIPDGVYLFRATFVGYISFTKDTLNIKGGNTVNLGAIKMRPSKGVLKEVTVTAQRSQIQLSTDKKVFSVEQSLVSQGGSATDLLSNVPSVQVDVDGNINLRGSSNVRILINGKPSALTGANLTDILQSIPASSIENIEVITNPSSKYDAEGQSGIINIVLKRNAQTGFNGSVSATAGTQHTYNGSVNLNYQNKLINVYANYSYRKGRRIGNGTSQTNTIDSLKRAFNQYQVNDQEFRINSNNIRSGIDFSLDPKTTLSFSNNINIRSYDRFQTGGTTVSSPLYNQTINRNNTSTGNGNNLDFNLDFSHKYKKPQEELTANVGYSTSKNNNTDNLNTAYDYSTGSFTDYSLLQNNYTIGRQHNVNLQADFVLPLNHNNRLEMGYRSTFNKNDNNYLVDTLNNATNIFVPADTLSNHFVYNEQVHAAYTNYQQSFGKFSIQGGVRLEEALINTTTTTLGQDEKHKQDYFRVYPSLFLTEKLTDNQTLQLSYSRRVSRPRDRQISPFLDRSDRQNYQQGNPFLKPEDTHSFELSYINYWKALTLTSSLYYRLTYDNIQQIQSNYDPSGIISLTKFENLKNASNAGYELIAKLSPSSKIDLTGNVNVYYRNIEGDPTLRVASTSGYAWNANLTANFKPVSKLGIQLRGDYQGPQVIAQGRMKSMYGLDGGLRYDITKTLNFSANARDIFNTRKFRSVRTYGDAESSTVQSSDRRWATRIVLFTLAYRFGSNTPAGRQRQQRRQDQQQDQESIPDDAQPGNGGGSQQGQGARPATGGQVRAPR
ncbi:TonB-dependent receptor domain-containing protein [Mucilaginibacter sp. KACC 22063]|uniref:TonB-dependent receptor domain-containing protein n=1 Tax=Mucilaginibacter sp. KACC 22063 TaxID=3025666 RepID=UPI002365E942|nr:TonB-dependent receptor [Mucilaginibacter sp. KACC 22063]WDF55687.1 TonB-dependent receptor [Mucilaginibacter sp. KACC 22063]